MRKKIPLLLLSVFFLSSPAFAGKTITLPTISGTQFTGEKAGDYAGETVLSAGDMNGDYIPDVAVSVRNYQTSVHSGMIGIFAGKPEGLPVNLSLANADYKIIGNSYSWTGSKTFAPSDLDGDRLTELVFTSDVNLYILRGNKNMPASIPVLSIGQTIPGVKISTGGFVKNVKFADVNGDNVIDLIFSSKDVYVISGKIIPFTGTIALNDSFFDGIKGTKIEVPASAGSYTDIAVIDVDRNGAKDIVIANSTIGRAYILKNNKTALPAKITLSDAYFKGTNGTAIDTYTSVNAFLVHNVGDINSDSFNDVAMSGSQYPNMTDIVILPGRSVWPAFIKLLNETNLIRIRGIGALNINASQPITPAGDYNSDGVADFMVGDQANNRAVIIEGRANWPSLYTVLASEQSDNTKITGPSGTGSMVSFAENLYGGIGCATDLSYIIGTNAANGIGAAFILNLKK